MAETLVENQVCHACQADIRDGALFCYNCGGSVVNEKITREVTDSESVESVLPQAEIFVNGNKNTKAEPSSEQLKQTEKDLLNQTEFEKVLTPTESAGQEKLKSAAKLKRNPKVPPKKVEIVWEEHENPPNSLFILVALILVLFTIAVLFLAMYLR